MEGGKLNACGWRHHGANGDRIQIRDDDN